MRFSIAFAIGIAIALSLLGTHLYYQYSQRHHQLRLAADRALMDLKECQRAYSETDPRCREADNVATTALKAWNNHAWKKGE